MNIFAKNLKWLRKKSGMNQLEMATELGFTQTRWSGYETGSSKPNFDQLMEIIKYFGVSATELLEKDLEADQKNNSPAADTGTPNLLAEQEHPYITAAMDKDGVTKRLMAVEIQLQQIWSALAELKAK
ncbi:MAG TPA: helix-turn-helix transcriptional regulator [Ferruginibacter sp.]|nr:helix-turn-helix transcriptional regulator [Ferruginibacter sp.]HMP21742.1 helix-turn-helix transcriptional regulator [Ferruginibacter sp.]